MVDISVIIPAYNVAKYIDRCLVSLLAQTHESLEIIIVDDGSKDGTLAIAKMFAERDERIKVIHQENQGVAQARNTGMDLATGKYIGFVDPDDWIEKDMYAALYQCIEASDYPMCMCNYYKDTRKSSSPQKFPFSQTSLDSYEVIEELISPMIGLEDLLPKYTYVMGCVWRCLYRRDFIEEHKLRFTKGISIMEDLVFNIEVLLKVNGVCIDHGYRYHYMKNKTSVLHSYNEKMWQDQMLVHELLEKMLAEAGLEEYMRNRLDMRYIGMTFSAIYNEVNRGSKKAIREKLKNVVAMCGDEKFKITLDRAKPIQRRRGLEDIGQGKEGKDKNIMY